MAVTKVKELANPEIGHPSEVPLSRSFVGKVTLHWHEQSDYGPGFQILVNGGWALSTSLVRDVVQKSPTKWLAKTMNSVYRVEVAE
jgi:hypothetical protein